MNGRIVVRFTFRLKLFIGLILSLYVMVKSGDWQTAMTYLSLSRNLGVEGAASRGWALLFSGFVVSPIFIAILISVAIRLLRGLAVILGLKSAPQRRSPRFATREQKRQQEGIVDAEWKEVIEIEKK
ncbi:hypothetical protein C100_08725 [Sphingobium sp. C100]|nr:hypothetical protein C100_08725 [Sphingobium sp. C100]